MLIESTEAGASARSNSSLGSVCGAILRTGLCLVRWQPFLSELDVFLLEALGFADPEVPSSSGSRGAIFFANPLHLIRFIYGSRGAISKEEARSIRSCRQRVS